MRLLTSLLTHRSLTMMMLVLMSGHLTEMASAQSHCDPVTQYEEGGRCCNMCSPGTSMRQRNCLDPQCAECKTNEYQDKYTTEPMCERQPYCDPNKNFQVSTQVSKTKRITCQCLQGFHCSSVTCLTCVPHTTCEPGHEAHSIGNQTHDTVCQKCPKGSFSSSKSWRSVCSKWTECASGYHVEQGGTAVSDNVCEKTSRQHTVMIIILAVFGCLLLLFGLVYYMYKRHLKGRKKICLESCNGDHQENVATLMKISQVDNTEKLPMFPEASSEEGDSILRSPEENEDEPSDDFSEGVIVTEKGNLCKQETGKTEIHPQQESQTRTLIN